MKATYLQTELRLDLLDNYPPFLEEYFCKTSNPELVMKKWNLTRRENDKVNNRPFRREFNNVTNRTYFFASDRGFVDLSDGALRYSIIRPIDDSIEDAGISLNFPPELTKSQFNEMIKTLKKETKIVPEKQVREGKKLVNFMKARFEGHSRKEALKIAEIEFQGEDCNNFCVSQIELIDSIIQPPERYLSFKYIERKLL